ncbi:MAG: sugar transferase [Planctomycetes bacterium]|nr:sugar transferase [Planctomycetota bacterium]
MKAILLAGGESPVPYPLASFCPRPLLPVCNRPLLEWQLAALRRNGFDHIALALSPEDMAAVSGRFVDGSALGVRLEYAAHDVPCGPAGCLRLFEKFIGGEPFLVVNGTTFPGEADLSVLVRAATEHQAIAVLGVRAGSPSPTPASLENLVVGSDGCVERFDLRHASRERRRRHEFSGVYFFRGDVLRWIAQDGYADIKEQLISDLRGRGETIWAEVLPGSHAMIDGIGAYVCLHRELLRSGGASDPGALRSEGVWAAAGARIAPSAFLLGPVLLGRGCTIDEGAKVIGPAVLGEGVVVGSGAVVRESILWDRAAVGDGACLEYCTVGFDAAITAGARLRHEVVPSRGGSRASVPLQDRDGRGGMPIVLPAGRRSGTVRTAVGLALKRALDVVVAAAGLVVLSPLLLLIALAIKFDSPGPVFFVQRRSGRGGREFKMYKFRAMVEGADKMQKDLAALNDVDGPVFKIFDDPRVTRVGRFLRRNSLDELPQLYNVLKGEMSLVGPRPLVMDEMRFSPAWRDLRLSVKPGITGIWQVNGRSETGFHDWVRHDIAYVKNWSLGLDVRVLMKTALWVARRTGAF